MRGVLRLACWGLGVAVLSTVLAVAPAFPATITIVNIDGPGEGFNDPTPASPVGGNPGTTIGAQRLFVFNHAAAIWGTILPSSVEIRVRAQFGPLSCTPTSGVLGSAGPASVWRDFPGAPVPGHWYHVALANKLSGSDLDPASDDINANFNSSLGQPGCLETSGWYYGIDGNEGSLIELLPVVLHELGHGLGFSTTTSGATGSYSSGFPHIYDHFLFDNQVGLHWDQMTAAQRLASVTACTRLVWDGPYATQKAPEFLNDKPLLRVNAPAGIAGDYEATPASFGPALASPGVTGNVVLVDDGVGNPSNGCEALVNGGAVSGNVALLDRGGCPFIVKVKNAQNAGAIAVIVADSVPGCPPAGLGGVDPTITIPSMRVTQADGSTLKANLGSGLNVTLTRDPAFMAGADAAGHVKVYTPSTFAGGSSISHWDVTADPDLLMEPALSSTLSSDVDLTRSHFADIGWFNDVLAVGPRAEAQRLMGNTPNPFRASTLVRFALERDQDVALDIYDLSGRLVSSLQRGRMVQGPHAVAWDGRDRHGNEAGPGIYVVRLKTGAKVESRSMVLVR